MEDSFILVNLNESKAKKLAQVISNNTSRKILDYLAKKNEATETQIAKDLQLPLSTVHYNMKHLKEANLVKVDEFHYSEKGKAMDHYKLSNKFVIIAPDETRLNSVKESLSKILPVALVSLIASGLIHLFTQREPLMLAQKASDEILEAAPMMLSRDAGAVITETIEPNIALWFLIGSFVAMSIFFVVDIIRKKLH
ncbi:MAG: helix-turn-helix domain-containing protein [Nanoarchaeota archaeon]|nr:helix-turn-helix domain-containing protein [Nanoarchaeota archaeon]MBU4242462.1 helix-turn-helix domain-containing protein [Nanoarchaeota archaeon]MBU4352435.1 helix-turn-helix domain-containing protein [Nanoarchaeota archaeon]MBU4456944.1 helix-turn-helix domain-containing protein [Nanoarchaeota archaeon]